MARLARVVVPDLPHHVTQRGNGRQRTFFVDADYALYRDLLAESLKAAGVACWAWVLMPNHVHLILVPSDADGLRRALAPVHRRYAGVIHARRKRSGHFWQGRFGCAVMDEDHLAAALVYVMLNPVRARLVGRAQEWRWSSARLSEKRRRRAHANAAGAGAVCRYRRDAEARSGCGRIAQAQGGGDDRATVGRAGIPAADRAQDRARSHARQTRA